MVSFADNPVLPGLADLSTFVTDCYWMTGSAGLSLILLVEVIETLLTLNRESRDHSTSKKNGHHSIATDHHKLTCGKPCGKPRSLRSLVPRMMHTYHASERVARADARTQPPTGHSCQHAIKDPHEGGNRPSPYEI